MMLARIGLALALASLFLFGLAAQADDAAIKSVQGQAKALSGDLIEVAGEVFFLNGVSAAKGGNAKAALVEILKRGQIACTPQKESQGSKPTAVCDIDGEDVSVALLKTGQAAAFSENKVDLGKSVNTAILVVEGLKDGIDPPRDCNIKGNRSGKKPYRLIYHMPGDPQYSRTKINANGGEGWFCSEATAEAAGYQRVGS
jgi:hypothetical protein